MRQPVLFVVAMAATLFIILSNPFATFTLENDQRMFVDIGLSSVFLAGVISSFSSMFIGATGNFVAALVKTMKLQPVQHVATHSALATFQHFAKSFVFGFVGFNFSEYLILICGMILSGFIGTVMGRKVLTNFGACVEELTAGKLIEEDNRLISGSVLCGHICEGPLAYLSSFSNQLTVIREVNQDDREFLNWLRPEIKKHSSLRMFLTSAIKNYKYNLTSALNGGFRAIVPVGIYEDIFPMNLMITQLLKAIVTEDTELAQNLGVLELDEEDLALCTYSCPSKYDYGLILRNILEKIEKDG